MASNYYYDFGTEATNEIRIVIIGTEGSGKSATGNTILGRDTFESVRSSRFINTKCSWGSAKRFGKDVLVVDTPSLFHSGMRREQITKDTVKCLDISSPGPHAFCLVLSTCRFTKEHIDTIKQFGEIFGEDMYNHTLVLFTYRDRIERENIDINEFIQRFAPREIQSLLQKCNGRVIAINNVQERYMREIDAENILNIVDKITNINGGSYYKMRREENATEKMHRIKHETMRSRKINDVTEGAKQFQRRYREEERKIDSGREHRIQEEKNSEFHTKIATIRTPRREAEKKEHEFRGKAMELEHKLSRKELYDPDELMAIGRELDDVNMNIEEMNTKIREEDEQEARRFNSSEGIIGNMLYEQLRKAIKPIFFRILKEPEEK